MSLPSPACALSQLLARHLDAWRQQALSLVAVPGHFQLASIDWSSSLQAPVSVWTADWRVRMTAVEQQLPVAFVSQQAPSQLEGRVVVFWPKAREEGYWWLEQLSAYELDEFYLLGENQGGVKAAAKALEKSGFIVTKLDSARRCSLYEVIPPAQGLAEALPRLPEETYSEGPEGLELFSMPGVFGQGRVDEGSALLIDALRADRADLPWQGSVLDLGCGHGLLGAWLLKQRPDCQLVASDVSGFALISAKTTLEINRLEAKWVAADIFKGLEKVCQPASLELIISNPPFHTGKGTDYELAERLIREAPYWLRPGGQLWLVANRFLPYPDLLEQAFGGFQRRAETGKFIVYQASKSN